MSRSCVHGDVCRAYIREKGCILRSTCPNCEHYVPAPQYPGLTVDMMALLAERVLKERSSNDNLQGRYDFVV